MMSCACIVPLSRGSSSVAIVDHGLELWEIRICINFAQSLSYWKSLDMKKKFHHAVAMHLLSQLNSTTSKLFAVVFFGILRMSVIVATCYLVEICSELCQLSLFLEIVESQHWTFEQRKAKCWINCKRCVPNGRFFLKKPQQNKGA